MLLPGQIFSLDLDGDVFAQKIDGQGNLLWQEVEFRFARFGECRFPLNMEPDNEGGVYIVWVDSRHPGKDLFSQHLSASGSALWTIDGIPVANGLGDEIQNTMLPDGQGGMIIAYTHTYADNDDLYAKRFNSSGTMLWANAVTISNAQGSQAEIRMAALTGGEFVFTWQDKRFNDPDIMAQKINLAGDLLWGDYLVIYSEQDSLARPQLNPRIVKTSDNGAIIIWEDYRLDTQNADLFAQKVSMAGIKLWNDAGISLCTAEYAQIGLVWFLIMMAAVLQFGMIYAMAMPLTTIYMLSIFLLRSVALWEANGKPICTAPNQQSGSFS